MNLTRLLIRWNCWRGKHLWLKAAGEAHGLQAVVESSHCMYCDAVTYRPVTYAGINRSSAAWWRAKK